MNIGGIVMTDYRKERDSLGEVEVPFDALYGANSLRAKITLILHPHPWIKR